MRLAEITDQVKRGIKVIYYQLAQLLGIRICIRIQMNEKFLKSCDLGDISWMVDMFHND